MTSVLKTLIMRVNNTNLKLNIGPQTITRLFTRIINQLEHTRTSTISHTKHFAACRFMFPKCAEVYIGLAEQAGFKQ
jgi:hypothetical protein